MGGRGRHEGESQSQIKPIRDVRMVERLMKAQAQHDFTDPESRIRQPADGSGNAYNAQLAVEPGCFPLIVWQAAGRTEGGSGGGIVRATAGRTGKADGSRHRDGAAEALSEVWMPAWAGACGVEPGGASDAARKAIVEPVFG